MENEKDYNFRNISERINKEWDKCKLINIKLKNLNAKSIFCNIITLKLIMNLGPYSKSNKKYFLDSYTV